MEEFDEDLDIKKHLAHESECRSAAMAVLKERKRKTKKTKIETTVPKGFRDWASVARSLGENCSGPCGQHPCECERLAEMVAKYIESLENRT
jgi:hypothetical protein